MTAPLYVFVAPEDQTPAVSGRRANVFSDLISLRLGQHKGYTTMRTEI